MTANPSAPIAVITSKVCCGISAKMARTPGRWPATVSANNAETSMGDQRDAMAAKGVQQRGDRDRGIGRFGFGEDKGFDDMQDRGAVDHHDSGRTLLQSAAPLICGWDDRRSPVRSPSR